MDVATLIRKVQRRFGDDNSMVITVQDIIDWVNAGQQQIAKETKCLSTTLSQNASTFPVTIPSDFLKLERITYAGLSVPYISVEELDKLAVDLTYNGAPDYFYISDEKFYLFPDPANSDTTTVVIYYSKMPALLTAIVPAYDLLTIPAMLHEDLVTYVLISAHERNENWKAVEILTATLTKNLPYRTEDSNVVDDTFPIVRDGDL